MTEHPSSPKSSKTARAYAKTYKLGPPLVPAIIVSQILQYIHKIIVRKKPEFVEMVARYWSLKREARRGAPLLKRLHLEPWTVSAAIRNQTDDEKTKKLEVRITLCIICVFNNMLCSSSHAAYEAPQTGS